jgi:DNA-binding response OmpR family regulator
MNSLIPDADPSVRHVLERILRDNRHQVSVAHDGLEAWSLFEKGAGDPP